MADNIPIQQQQSEILAKLGDDVQVQIFKVLPLASLIKVQNVCHDWRRVVRCRFFQKNIPNHKQPSEILAKLGEDELVQIFKVLPLATLIKVQYVCYDWRRLVRSRLFKKNYHENQRNPHHHLLVMAKSDTGYQFHLLVDDYAFPSDKVTFKAPEPLRSLTNIRMLGNFQGYQLFVGVNSENKMIVVLWNLTPGVLPVVIDVPTEGYKSTVVGLWISPDSDDFKLYKFGFYNSEMSGLQKVDVGVSTLHEREWRDVKTGIYLGQCMMECAKLCVKGVMYFRAFDRYKYRYNCFKTFDLTNMEEFGEVRLPEGFTRNFIQSANVNGSVGLLQYHNGVCDVWAAKGEGANEFTRMRTVEGVSSGDVLAFRNNREPVVELRGCRGIGFYDPLSGCITDINVGVGGKPGSFFVTPYTPYFGNTN